MYILGVHPERVFVCLCTSTYMTYVQLPCEFIIDWHKLWNMVTQSVQRAVPCHWAVYWSFCPDFPGVVSCHQQMAALCSSSVFVERIHFLYQYTQIRYKSKVTFQQQDLAARSGSLLGGSSVITDWWHCCAIYHKVVSWMCSLQMQRISVNIINKHWQTASNGQSIGSQQILTISS